MKTYAESRGEKPFDWNAFLKNESYTVDECKEADGLARHWVTCACGNQCDVIPRGITGAPKDFWLRHFGDAFCANIRRLLFAVKEGVHFRNEQQAAMATLQEIEKRAAKIIAEIEAQKK